MLYHQGQGLQAFRRVDAWFPEHPEVIPASGSSAPALENQVNTLKGVIARMTEQGIEQERQKDQALLIARDEPSLRTDLRARHIKAIVLVATALRGDVPGIGVIRMPESHGRSEALVKAAEALSTTAAIYQDVLIEHGLPRDFLPQLNAATAALKAAIDARGLARSKRKGATVSVAQDYDLGRRVVAMIDASLLHVLKADSPTYASWLQAKRIVAKPVAPRTPDIAAATLSSGGAAPAPATGGPTAVAA